MGKREIVLLVSVMILFFVLIFSVGVLIEKTQIKCVSQNFLSTPNLADPNALDNSTGAFLVITNRDSNRRDVNG